MEVVSEERPDRITRDTDVRLGFGDLEHAAAARREIGLGLRLAQGDLLLNPDRDARWELTELDEVAILTPFAEGCEARSTCHPRLRTGAPWTLRSATEFAGGFATLRPRFSGRP